MKSKIVDLGTVWMASAVLLCSLAVGAQEPRKVEEMNPIKKLAIAKADAEIALNAYRDAATACEQGAANDLQELSQAFQDLMTVIQQAQTTESAKGEQADQAFMEKCAKEMQSRSEMWNAQQTDMRKLDLMRNTVRENNYRLANLYGLAVSLSDGWKEAKLDMEVMLTVFKSLTDQYTKAAVEANTVVKEITAKVDSGRKALEAAKKEFTAPSAAKKPAVSEKP